MTDNNSEAGHSLVNHGGGSAAGQVDRSDDAMARRPPNELVVAEALAMLVVHVNTVEAALEALGAQVSVMGQQLKCLRKDFDERSVHVGGEIENKCQSGGDLGQIRDKIAQDVPFSVSRLQVALEAACGAIRDECGARMAAQDELNHELQQLRRMVEDELCSRNGTLTSALALLPELKKEIRDRDMFAQQALAATITREELAKALGELKQFISGQTQEHLEHIREERARLRKEFERIVRQDGHRGAEACARLQNEFDDLRAHVLETVNVRLALVATDRRTNIVRTVVGTDAAALGPSRLVESSGLATPRTVSAVRQAHVLDTVDACSVETAMPESSASTTPRYAAADSASAPHCGLEVCETHSQRSSSPLPPRPQAACTVQVGWPLDPLRVWPAAGVVSQAQGSGSFPQRRIAPSASNQFSSGPTDDGYEVNNAMQRSGLRIRSLSQGALTSRSPGGPSSPALLARQRDLPSARGSARPFPEPRVSATPLPPPLMLHTQVSPHHPMFSSSSASQLHDGRGALRLRSPEAFVLQMPSPAAALPTAGFRHERVFH